MNSSLGRSTVAWTLDTTSIAPRASVDVQFVLGVQQGGAFRFLLNVEALPGPSTVTTAPESDLKAGGMKTTGGRKGQQ